MEFNSGIQIRSHMPQYLACGILCIGGFLGGTVTGWSSPALPSIEASGDFDLRPFDLSWIVSIANLGLFVSAPMAGYLIKKIGRKNTLLFSTIPSTIGWALLALPVHIGMLYAGRFLSGLGNGLTIIAGSVYLTEIAEPCLRGTLSGIWFVAIRLGVLFVFAVGSVISYDKLSAISVIISVAFAGSILYLPESPRWLMAQQKRETAMDSLIWLRACENSKPTPKLLVELEEIEEAVLRAEVNKAGLSFYFTKATLGPVFIALFLMFFKEACGGNVISYYTIQVFEKTGSPFDSHTSGIIVGIAQLLPLLALSLYVDKVGRKVLLIFSYTLISLSLVIIALYCQFKTEFEAIQGSSWIPLIAFLALHAAYSGGPFVLSWTVSSEVIPSNIIAFVSGLASAFGWMSAFVFTLYYENMCDSIGITSSFLVYAVLSVMGAVGIHILVPETMGKSLESIHQDQNQNSAGRNNQDKTETRF